MKNISMMRIAGFIMSLLLWLSAGNADAQNTSVATNLFGYLDFGTLNVESSYAVDRHWSVDAWVKYNPFSYDSEKKDRQVSNRQQAYAVGARYWPWHVFSGWWVTGKLQYQEYNFGGLVSQKTDEGDRYGAGLTAGYTYMLHPHLNLEFGLGFWMGYDDFVRYSCPTCGMTLDKGERFFILPNDVIAAITYIF